MLSLIQFFNLTFKLSIALSNILRGTDNLNHLYYIMAEKIQYSSISIIFIVFLPYKQIAQPKEI